MDRRQDSTDIHHSPVVDSGRTTTKKDKKLRTKPSSKNVTQLTTNTTMLTSPPPSHALLTAGSVKIPYKIRSQSKDKETPPLPAQQQQPKVTINLNDDVIGGRTLSNESHMPAQNLHNEQTDVKNSSIPSTTVNKKFSTETFNGFEPSDAKHTKASKKVDELTDLREKYKILVHNYETVTVDRDSYAEQLQVQSKVNAELKKLLVATMGDDLQLKMECLTNDKVKLAQDIVHYTSQLSSDKEDLDRLGIQSDVWRSKFLASNVMVDELVSWRYFLIRQFEEAQRGLRLMTEEHDQYRKKLYHSFLLLQEILESLEPHVQGKYRNLTQCHTIGDLTEALNDFCSSLHRKLLNNYKISGASDHNRQIYGEKKEPMVGCTEGEKIANKLLSIDAKNFYSTSPCDEFQRLTDRQAKLMGYPSHCNFRNLTINCCRKCEGEIKLV